MSHGSIYILVGLSKGEFCFTHPEIHAEETTIMCSRNIILEGFEYVIDILEKKLLPAATYMAHEVDFQVMIAHFDRWLDPANGVIKATVNF